MHVGQYPNPSLPVAWRLQWESRGGHSHPEACAFTVAGQWRNFTALPDHSDAGKSLNVQIAGADEPQDRGEIQVVRHVVDKVKKENPEQIQVSQAALFSRAVYFRLESNV